MSLATFINAGAKVPSTVVSLWEVDDLATRDLMVRFYEVLLKQKPVHKARALQEAQRSLASKPETRHPFFWSAFILIGDWR
ncbi:MAG: CHAT domain-containing protein [Deltaproteobacteria bacterium]|nr:CHAT domain-containing protein [Deltaproteobacteria bacterium]